MSVLGLEHTPIEDLMIFLKWAVGVFSIVIAGMATAIVALWSRLKSKSREYASTMARKEDEIAKARKDQLEDVRDFVQQYHDALDSVRQSIQLLSQSIHRG